MQRQENISLDDLGENVRRAFAECCDGNPDVLAYAPGRVNLIGEHTDYNDGFVLPMAIGCGTMVAGRARADGQIKVFAVDLDMSRSSFATDQPILPDAQQPWSNYVRGVAAALQEDGLTLPGADLVIAGNVPKGAGLSSSASLEIATGLALATLAGQPDYDRTALALAGQRAENEFAGCNCGIMDQLVSARAKSGKAMLLDCRSLDVVHADMPKGVAVMIVHSGIDRGLVDGEYNARRNQCEDAAEHYGVAALRDLDLAGLDAGKHGLDPIAYLRARHVVSENERTILAADALQNADLVQLGKLMADSHISMRDDFAITTPEIDRLVALLQAAIGKNGGARMTGGGFGGAVVSLMSESIVTEVREHLDRNYNTPSGNRPFVTIERAVKGASIIPY